MPIPTYQELVDDMCEGVAQNPSEPRVGKSLGTRLPRERKPGTQIREGSVTASSTLKVAVLTKNVFREALQCIDQLSKQNASLRSMVKSPNLEASITPS